MADVLKLVGQGYNNLTTNLRNSFAGMAPENWIRLVIIVGTYMLIRPYLLKLGAKTQMKQHEKEAAETKAAAIEQAKMSPNELRGHKIAGIPEDSDEEEVAQAESTSADWGKKARKRQRQMIKKILDAEEKRLQDLQEDDEDKDIQEFLVD